MNIKNSAEKLGSDWLRIDRWLWYYFELVIEEGGEGRMNREVVNNRVSQLPIAMAGIVHAAVKDARSLSIYAHTELQLTKRHLP